MTKAAGQGTPAVSGSQVFAAGLASTGAAFVTSKFGIAGTILGAALTTMIITGGAAIGKAYLESVTGNVRKVPQKLQARRERRKGARYAEPQTLPERPDLRDNFMGRMRAAVGWFSHLPLPARRSILVKGLIAAAVAFVISMGAVYAVERGIGNSLSCGLWGTCPEGATPGIHLTGGGGTGAGSTIGGGRVSQSSGIDRDGGVFRSDQQSSPLRQQDPGYQPPAQQRQSPSDPNVAPVDPNGEPAPVEPVEPEVPSEPGQPVPGQPVPGQPTPQPGQPTPQQQVPSEEGAEVPRQQGVPSGAEP